MKKFFLFIFLCFFCLKSFCIQKFYLKDIVWNIKNKFFIYKYKKFLFNKFGNFIEDRNIINVINYLYKIDYFSKIKIYKLNNNLYIYLYYKPIINNILVTGNKILSKLDILLFLKKFNIQKNVFLSNSSILEAKNFIFKKYRNLNKYNIKISFLKYFLKEKYCTLKINLNENQYLNIRNILLKKKYFLVKKKFNPFYKKNYFFSKIFNSFIDFNLNNFILHLNLIKEFYFNYGYLNFTIKKIKFIFLSKKNIDIKICFFEGKRYKIHDLLIYSNKNIEFDKILNNIKYTFFYKDMYYKHNLLNNIISYINFFFKKNGFLNVDIDLDYQILNDNKIIVFFYVKLDKIFYVNNIFLKNVNLYESKFLFKNNIPKIKNNLYNEYLINLGKLNLEKTNFFSSIYFKKKIYRNSINKLDIIYFLKKKYDSKLNFGLNYDKKNNLNYELSLLKNNFLYLGNDLFIKGVKNNFGNYSEINLINPINYMNNFYIKHKLFYNYIFNNYLGDSNNLNINYGYKNYFIFKLNDFFKYKFGINYIYNTFYKYKYNYDLNYFQFFTNINNYLNIKKKIIKNFLIINNFYINKLDNNILPKYGFYINFNSKFTFPNIYNNFYKMYISWSKYFFLNNQWIFFIHNYLGYGNGFKNNVLPFYENLDHLKEKSLRVFNENISYNNYYISNKKFCNNKCFLSSNKNNLVFLLTNELIIPNKFIFLNNYFLNKNVRASWFIDSGFSLNTNLLNKLYLKDFLKVSTGISLKFTTYFGTINLSYGFPLYWNINDKISNFQFNIGNFF